MCSLQESFTVTILLSWLPSHFATSEIPPDFSQIDSDAVVFPGPSSRRSFVPNIPEKCLQMGICEDVPDFPESQIANIIEGLGDAAKKYEVDVDIPAIAQRIDSPEETELCDSLKRVIIPQAASDTNGNWRYILNLKSRPIQRFHVEICKNPMSPCSNLATFHVGYESSCNQKFILRDMASLSENGTVVEKAFKLPSSCTCAVRQTN